MCNMVCLMCFGVSSLVGDIYICPVIKKEHILLPTILLKSMNAKHTILNNTVFLRMNPPGFKLVRDIRNEI